MTDEAEVKPEVEYKLSLNEMTDIINKNIKNNNMKGYMVCVSTHVKSGVMSYVIFKDRHPIYESQQAEAISIFLDLLKFDDERGKNDKKSSSKRNSSRTSGLRSRRS